MSAREDPSATHPREEYVEVAAGAIVIGLDEVAAVVGTEAEETEDRLVLTIEDVVLTDVALRETALLDAETKAEETARVVEFVLVATEVALAFTAVLVALDVVELEALV